MEGCLKRSPRTSGAQAYRTLLVQNIARERVTSTYRECYTKCLAEGYNVLPGHERMQVDLRDMTTINWSKKIETNLIDGR
jgi:hypothetical protein